MASLGSKKHPAFVRVQTTARAEQILADCDVRGWIVVVGVEPDKEEDTSDYDRLRHPPQPVAAPALPGRNDPCSCGSGRKFKKCCALVA